MVKCWKVTNRDFTAGMVNMTDTGSFLTVYTTDPKLRNEMGENGYKALVEKYNPQVAYSKIAEILSFS